jgi:hypothetical protein
MVIHLKKGRDGPSTVACVRADGSRTWARLHPFFPEHDLTHCAVETVFGFREAFFGLVAAGWQIDDFAAPEARRRMPVEALWAESIVGLFDLERGTGRMLSAAELTTALAEALRGQGVAAYRALEESEVQAVRGLRGRLLVRWREVAPGETLEVPFPAAGW